MILQDKDLDRMGWMAEYNLSEAQNCFLVQGYLCPYLLNKETLLLSNNFRYIQKKV